MGKKKDQKASSTTEVKVPKELQPLLYGQPGGMTPGTWQPPAQTIPGIPLTQAAYPPGQGPAMQTPMQGGMMGRNMMAGPIRADVLGHKGQRGK